MVSRGQIYFAALDPIQGREQAGRRPVLVISSNAINRQPPGETRRATCTSRQRGKARFSMKRREQALLLLGKAAQDEALLDQQVCTAQRTRI
jgi:mRNA-degrading endonuclease toxin of MazEF toxin-antitoxin module